MEIMALIRHFNTRKGNFMQPRGLLDDGPDEHKRMWDIVTKMTSELKAVLKLESRCPNVTTPCLVMGDIHGNLEDLLTLENQLWRTAPFFPTNYIFLGDYVDRGKWSVECALYLMALKLMAPKKIILLRGNHEVRQLQEKYSYKRECFKKYGFFGEKIWELTNQVFDLLPPAATLDKRIFCTHGGLSPNGRSLEDIYKVPINCPNPELQSKAVWELLWSDPCHTQQFLDILEVTDDDGVLSKEGFLYNAKRGAAYLFNERAAMRFFRKNHLSHMIRGHEVPPYGFAHHFNNLCTTVFSCSHYCNYDNEAACIMVDESGIRVIRLDTHNNAPATDR